MFLLTLLCTPHHIPTCHISICKLCHSFLLCDLYLGCHQFIFYGPSTFKMYLYAISLAYVLSTLTEALHIRNSNVTSIDGIRFGVFVVIVFRISRSTGLQLGLKNIWKPPPQFMSVSMVLNWRCWFTSVPPILALWYIRYELVPSMASMDFW